MASAALPQRTWYRLAFLRHRLFESGAIPILIGLVLLTAALLKGHDLASRDVAARDLLGSRGLLAAAIAWELALGLWLVSGLYAPLCRWVALLTFVVFFEVALYLVAIGAGSCGCLGRVAIGPVWASVFDAASVVLLWFWRPAPTRMSWATHRRWLVAFVVAYVVTAAVVLVAVFDYAPSGPMQSLRHDPRLVKTVTLNLENANPDDVLRQLQQATGVAMTIDPALVDSNAASLGTVRTRRSQAWSLMEWLAQTRPRPARWKLGGEGYRLVPAARLGQTLPWIVSVAILVAAVMAAVIVQSRRSPLGAGHHE